MVSNENQRKQETVPRKPEKPPAVRTRFSLTASEEEGRKRRAEPRSANEPLSSDSPAAAGGAAHALPAPEPCQAGRRCNATSGAALGSVHGSSPLRGLSAIQGYRFLHSALLTNTRFGARRCTQGHVPLWVAFGRGYRTSPSSRGGLEPRRLCGAAQLQIKSAWMEQGAFNSDV